MKWDRDLTGQRFGELTVLEATDERIGGGVVWLCRCSCGAICKVSRNNLVTGQTRSCGHAKRRDLTGQRFGRLVAVRPIRWRSKAHPCSVAWLCKCDCGSVAIAALANLTKGLKSSCGCIPRRPGRGHAICPGCGETFAINTDGKPTPQFCPTCAPKYAGRNWKVCPICRTLFPAPESDKTVTCSRGCSAAWKGIIHEGVSNSWANEAKARKRAEGQTANLQLGTAAAKASPIAGRFETNQEAKIWRLVDPSGNEIIVRNLLLWARENTERFGKPPGDRSAIQIASGFEAIAATLRGTRKTPSMTYFGWTLKDVPEVPPPEG